MKINPQALRAFRRTVAAQLELWDSFRDFEKTLGRDFDRFSDQVVNFAAGCESTGDAMRLTPEHAEEFLALLKKENKAARRKKKLATK